MPLSDHLTEVVVPRQLDAATVMPRTRQGAKAGYVDMRPLTPSAFRPVLDLPAFDYVLVDVELGGDLLNVSPQDAERVIKRRGRTPLTLEEGVAILLAHPGILRDANCFQMLASSAGDRRVPSLWVTREGRPRLGWCWRGTPHSWLGAASCASRREVANPTYHPAMDESTPLPKIGAPATRALTAAGFGTLEDLNGASRAMLLSLHGVGPRAIRILDEEMPAKGLSLSE